jgi:hypothetical protein
MNMTVYELRADVNRYQHLTLFNERDVIRLRDTFVGSPMAASWQPLLVEILRDARHRNRPRSDFPAFGGDPVFSKRAIEALRDLLEPNGEILPLRCHEGTYFAYNVTRLVDALDEARSELERFSSGRIMWIERPVFFPVRIASEVIFKIPQSPNRTFVTDRFAQRIQEQGLVGFDLQPVWSGPDGALQVAA